MPPHEDQSAPGNVLFSSRDRDLDQAQFNWQAKHLLHELANAPLADTWTANQIRTSHARPEPQALLKTSCTWL